MHIKNRILPIPPCNRRVVPYYGPDAIHSEIVPFGKFTLPIIRPLFVDMVIPTLQRNSSGEQYDRAELRQFSNQVRSPAFREMLDGLETHHKIERSMDLQRLLKILLDKFGQMDQPQAFSHWLGLVYAHYLRDTPTFELINPHTHSASNVDDALGRHMPQYF